MYRPPAFDVTERSILFDAIQENSFGVVIASSEGEFEAAHIPILLDRTRGENGALFGHVAKPNPLWRLADGQPVLAIFSGPHAYISPSWYGEPNVVPTWNYVAVHVSGRFRAIHEPDEIVDILKRSVDFYESAMPEPWGFDTDDVFMRKLVNGIVGFSIEIEKIEGKWKLGQNRSVASRARVADVLETVGDEDGVKTAKLMREM